VFRKLVPITVTLSGKDFLHGFANNCKASAKQDLSQLGLPANHVKFAYAFRQ
jgi:hypothetical protein